MPKIQILNCFILIVPVLPWNAIFTSKLPAEYSSDVGASQAILILEHVFRIPVFLYPILLPLQINDRYSKAGIAIYVAGVVVYFASWIMQLNFPGTKWSTSTLGILAPAYTPLIWLLGIGLIGHSWFYVLISVLFSFIHVLHNIQVFGFYQVRAGCTRRDDFMTKARVLPVIYEIRVKGHLDSPHWSQWFGDMTVTIEENGETILSGPVVDQAALHGLLAKVRDLGLPLLAVNRVKRHVTLD